MSGIDRTDGLLVAVQLCGFKNTAVSRLAAQHAEIVRLRTALAAQANVRSIGPEGCHAGPRWTTVGVNQAGAFEVAFGITVNRRGGSHSQASAPLDTAADCSSQS